MDLTCPKCHGPMRTYERNGVHVDQCTECRGIFLDRGELERLVDAENDWHERPRERSQERSYDERGDRHAGTGQQHGGSGYPAAGGAGLGAVDGEVLKQVGSQKHGGYGQQHSGSRPRKKESFLGDLFG